MCTARTRTRTASTRCTTRTLWTRLPSLLGGKVPHLIAIDQAIWIMDCTSRYITFSLLCTLLKCNIFLLYSFCCCLPCNWTWVNVEILAYGYSLRSTQCMTFPDQCMKDRQFAIISCIMLQDLVMRRSIRSHRVGTESLSLLLSGQQSGQFDR